MIESIPFFPIFADHITEYLNKRRPSLSIPICFVARNSAMAVDEIGFIRNYTNATCWTWWSVRLPMTCTEERNVINLTSKLSHLIFRPLNFNLTLTSHHILSFLSIFFILLSTDRKFIFAFDSVYRIKICIRHRIYIRKTDRRHF